MKTIRVHVTIWTMWCESLRACKSNTSIKDDENLLLYFDFVILRDYLLKFHMHQNFLFEKTFTKQFHVYVYYKPLTLTSQQIIRDMTFITSQGWNKFQLFSFAKSLETIPLLWYQLLQCHLPSRLTPRQPLLLSISCHKVRILLI